MYLRIRIGGNRQLEHLFFHAYKSYTLSDFQHIFCRLNHDACKVLANIGHAKWARAYFPNILREFVTTSNRLLLNAISWECFTGGYKSLFGGKKQRSHLRSLFNFKIICVVYLNRHTCSCGKWCTLGITCNHDIVASYYSYITDLEDMVQIYYWTDVFRTTHKTQNVHSHSLMVVVIYM
uniref:SWIM-type domain-containing protein n=1 Tax=Lactuca sativa TaxID=4236 RepID=A0A9R1USC2_LACSA|nr:hypothetical protein LSAT_V11C800407050 [Lactuca sativa]